VWRPLLWPTTPCASWGNTREFGIAVANLGGGSDLDVPNRSAPRRRRVRSTLFSESGGKTNPTGGTGNTAKRSRPVTAGGGRAMPEERRVTSKAAGRQVQVRCVADAAAVSAAFSSKRGCIRPT